MSSTRSETDIVRLRKLARRTAGERKETPSTVHLLAAIWSCGGPARELLSDRRLDDTVLLRAARACDEVAPDAIGDALATAREIAHRSAVPSRVRGGALSEGRSGAPEAPEGIHVLLALLANRNCAAHRALTQCGVDIARLRSAATRIALGVVVPPRARNREAVSAGRAQAAPVSSQGPRPARSPRKPSERLSGRAVQVPLLPPGRSARSVPLSPVTAGETCSSAGERARGRSTSASTAVESRALNADRSSVEKTSVERSKSDAASGPGHRSQLDRAQFSALSAATKSLSEAAEQGQFGQLVGRASEIEQVLDVLAKRHHNCPLLVGQVGVGKTSVARAVAQHFWEAEGRAEAPIVLQLLTSELLAGSSARGSVTQRLAELTEELRRASGEILLFIDDVHELLAMDEAAVELKTALAAGDIPMMAATSPEELRRLSETDPALARRFTVVEVLEPNEADAFLLLRAVAVDLGKHHRISYSDESLAATVSWSIRYLPGRALPDKAVSILDLVGARLRRRGKAEKVLPEHVAELVAELADVPVDRLTGSDHERMLKLQALLGERVVGHSEACDRIAAVLRRNAAGLRGRRPIGSFLLLGPTGVGKTEMAKAVAEVLFHSPDAMTRLDMSEYAEAHAVSRLVGAPPGYVGHEAGGLLTESVRRRPYQVVLLDEIEKAHQDVLLAFLQLFDEGRMTDGRGRTVDFTNTVVVLTSNLGGGELRAALNHRPVGFGARAASPVDSERMQEVALGAARAALPPELYNRLDEVVFFRHLDREDLHAIARRLLAALAASLSPRGIRLDVHDEVLEALLENGGYDPEFGARPLRRAITRQIEAPLADMILSGQLSDGSVAMVMVEGGQVVIDAVDRPAASPPRLRSGSAHSAADPAGSRTLPR